MFLELSSVRGPDPDSDPSPLENEIGEIKLEWRRTRQIEKWVFKIKIIENCFLITLRISFPVLWEFV